MHVCTRLGFMLPADIHNLKADNGVQTEAKYWI